MSGYDICISFQSRFSDMMFGIINKPGFQVFADSKTTINYISSRVLFMVKFDEKAFSFFFSIAVQTIY